MTTRVGAARSSSRLTGWSAIVLAVTLTMSAVQMWSPHASADPTSVGSWTAPTTIPFVAIHSVVMQTGRVLLFDRSLGNVGSPALSLDPTTGVTDDVRIPYPRDIFCAGHVILPGGGVFMSGGHPPTRGSSGYGARDTDVFDPVTGTWTPGPSMEQARWYPSNVTQGNGNALIFSGTQAPGEPVITVDRYYPATGHSRPCHRARTSDSRSIRSSISWPTAECSWWARTE